MNPTSSTGTGTDPEPLTVLTTGGTIDKIYNLAGELEIGTPAAREILDVARVGPSVTVESVVTKDSLDITDADRDLLLSRISRLEASRVVITHGTDTMTATAEHLQRNISATAGKTIVLTGAVQPAAMRVTDAHFNLGTAIAAARSWPAGVYICMNGRVHRAGTVVKNRSTGHFVAITESPRARS